MKIKMLTPNSPVVSWVLAIITIITSLTVSYLVNGHIWSTLKMVQLADWGGVTFTDLRNLEVWRIVTSQLVHSKMPHMFYNALCLGLLGGVLERKIGGLNVVLIWLIAGGIATVISPILIAPPYNIGTGASQAVFAFAGCASVYIFISNTHRYKIFGLILFAVLPGFGLDFIFAGYPKPGHISGFVLGILFGVFLRTKWIDSPQPTAQI